MAEKGYKIRNQERLHFITFAVVEWVDVFTRQKYRDIVIKSLEYCIDNKGLKLHAWVIMSNHIHFIVSAKEGFGLSNILRDFKKFTAVKIITAIKNNNSESRKDWMLSIFRAKGQGNSRNSIHQFWRQDNQPIELTDNKMIEQRINYLHHNPVEAGIVENAMDYLYSSAKTYGGEKGLIKIELI